MHFSKAKLAKMRREFAKHEQILVYIDGACTGNPGQAAASACFFGCKKPKE